MAFEKAMGILHDKLEDLNLEYDFLILIMAKTLISVNTWAGHFSQEEIEFLHACVSPDDDGIPEGGYSESDIQELVRLSELVQRNPPIE
jgi:hypothetical protein